MGYPKERIVSLLPLKVLRHLETVNPLIVNYHMISDHLKPHVEHLYPYRNTQFFRRDLEYFASHYVPVGLNTLLKAIKEGSPPPPKSFHLTFDDGFKEMKEIVAPILLKMGIPATFFLTSQLIDNLELQIGNKKSLLIHHIESNLSYAEKQTVLKLLESFGLPGSGITDRILIIPYTRRSLLDQIASEAGIDFQKFLQEHQPYMTSSQVRALIKEGFTIGGHSIDHPNYSELTLEEQLEQTLGSVKYVCDHFSLNYKVFAFPFSDKGVQLSFFKSIENKLDATFSNRGFFEDPVSFNFQRIGVEKSRQPVERALQYHYARKFLFRMKRQHIIIRK